MRQLGTDQSWIKELERSVASEAACVIASEAACVASEAACVASEAACVASGAACVASEAACVASEAACVASEAACVASEAACVARETACVAKVSEDSLYSKVLDPCFGIPIMHYFKSAAEQDWTRHFPRPYSHSTESRHPPR